MHKPLIKKALNKDASNNEREILIKWPLYSFSLGLIILGLGITAWQFGNKPEVISLFCFFFFVSGVSFHHLECYTTPGGFIQWFNQSFFRSLYEDKPFNTKYAMWINFPGFYILSILLVWLGHHISIFSLIPLGISLAHGIKIMALSFQDKSYQPGLVTSYLFLIPYPLFASFQLIGSGLFSRTGYAAGILLGWLLYTLTLISIRHRWHLKMNANRTWKDK